MRSAARPRPSRRLTGVRRLTALISAAGITLATWTTWAVTSAPGASAASSANPTATASTAASTDASTDTSTAPEHVVVVLKNQHDDLPASGATVGARVHATDADQSPLIAKAQHDGGSGVRQLHVANAFAVTVTPAAAADLAKDPSVAAVVPDTVVAAPKVTREQPARVARGPVSTTVCPKDPSKPLLEPEALQLTHDAFANPATPSAQKIATGKGVVVAFLADGLDINNPDFIRADGSHVFIDYQDFSGEGPNAPTPAGEAFGDASSIAAQGRHVYDLSTFVNPAHPLPPGCNIRVLGMAPGASLVGLKVFPAGGFAFNSAILQALDWAVTHDHADVINESFGSNQFPDTNNDPTAVFNEQLIHAGVTVVSSSGDSGPENTIGSPASAPDVISVGGTTQFRLYSQVTYNGFQLSSGAYRSNTVSGLSSGGVTQPGRTVDLAAPGDLGWSLCTANPNLYFDCFDNNGNPTNLEEFGGTSESAPLVAGAAALVIQAYRDSHQGHSPSAFLVKHILTSTADDLGLPAVEQGSGLVNALRAVHAAQKIDAPGGVHASPTLGANAGPGLLVQPGQLDLTTSPDSLAFARVKVTNLGEQPTLVRASVRGTGRVLANRTQTVTLNPNTDPTFLDQLGRPRAYREVKFTVPSGAANLHASIAWPSPSTIVRIVLLDPHGVYSAYSIPQGFGNFGEVDVPVPVAGTWTAVVFTGAGAAGFAGDVKLTTTSTAAGHPGGAFPSFLFLKPDGVGYVTVAVPSNANVGDVVDSLVLTPITRNGRVGTDTVAGAEADWQRNPRGFSVGASSVVPVVVRTLVALHGGTTGSATFHGTFGGGNGRPGIPEPAETYAFDVPKGAPNLAVGLKITGNPNEAFYGFLVDPNGEPVSEVTNQRADAQGNITLVPAIQLNHVAPQAGRWQLVFAVWGPVAGTSTSTSFTGHISLAAAKVSASGVPHSTSTKLAAGKAVTATVSFTNGGDADAGYFVDGRLNNRTPIALVVHNNPYTFGNDILPPFPAFSVPTESNGLHVSSTSSSPILFEISPFPADHQVDLSFEGDPDVEAGPAGTHPSVSLRDPIIAPQTWLALPSAIGPFGDAGAPTVTNTFKATAHTRPFDATVTSTSGDPLLADVDATPPAATPVSVAAGANGSITVTFTPSGASGTTVQGVLYLDTFDAVTGGTNEVAAIPYSYTIK